jgi:hypothetical protein
MAKWTKRILLTLGILIVLLLGAAVLIPILFKDKIEAAVKKEVNKNINAVVDWGEWDITILKSFPDLTVDHRGCEGEQRGALRRHRPGTDRFAHGHRGHQERLRR